MGNVRRMTRLTPSVDDELPFSLQRGEQTVISSLCTVCLMLLLCFRQVGRGMLCPLQVSRRGLPRRPPSVPKGQGTL